MSDYEKLATKGRDYIKKLKEKFREGIPEVPTVEKKKGGKVRGAGIARKGTRKCKMR